MTPHVTLVCVQEKADNHDSLHKNTFGYLTWEISVVWFLFSFVRFLLVRSGTQSGGDVFCLEFSSISNWFWWQLIGCSVTVIQISRSASVWVLKSKIRFVVAKMKPLQTVAKCRFLPSQMWPPVLPEPWWAPWPLRSPQSTWPGRDLHLHSLSHPPR